ncbi:MAG: metallophosphoesterase [Syntrophomonadaceae bacterium]|nr:metallophosphoesterase [Syntrophomonadaceae bacterium]
MKSSYLFAILIFALVFGSLNFYIGWHLWVILRAWVPSSLGWVYWAIFWLVALSYIIGRAGSTVLPGRLGTHLTVLGSYWLACMYYLVIILLLVDLIGFLDHRLGFLPEPLTNPHLAAAGVTLLTLGILVYGSWNAHHPRITEYSLEIPKKAGELSELRIVAASDVHLGPIVHNGRLRKMVEMVNSLEPDLVLLPGDIIDENIRPFLEQKMSETLRLLSPKYGTYAVLGNHEYMGGHVDETIRHLEEAGVKVLRDRWVLVADSFYVVGRDEVMSRYAGRRPRTPLSQILAGVDHTKPIIMIDHQPIDLDEADRVGIDLQVSGHTHLGQLFPNQLVTDRLFENDYGYSKKENLQVIVSCGYGTWGPPIRIGNTPEILYIKVKFTGS